MIEHQTRRIVHCNVTTYPTAAWTLQQLREGIPSDHGYCFLVHDRDGIFSPRLDQSITHPGLRILRMPPQSPQANSPCERVIGTLRRECLDFLIPLTENHLRMVTKYWVTHYNRGRPPPALGREFRTHQPIFLSHHKNIGIAYRLTLRLWLTLFSVEYTMNIAWLRRLLELLRSTAIHDESG